MAAKQSIVDAAYIRTCPLPLQLKGVVDLAGKNAAHLWGFTGPQPPV